MTRQRTLLSGHTIRGCGVLLPRWSCVACGDPTGRTEPGVPLGCSTTGQLVTQLSALPRCNTTDRLAAQLHARCGNGGVEMSGGAAPKFADGGSPAFHDRTMSNPLSLCSPLH